MKPELPRVLVVQVAALGYDLVELYPDCFRELNLTFEPLKPVFPAVTCTAQASFRTGLVPAEHGIICNGLYHRRQAHVDFWNQSARLLPSSRFWEDFRARGGRVGTVCWQQSLGDENVDLVLSPKPVHKHSGGIIQDCYTLPDNLYSRLCERIGRSFNLLRYWGPFASLKSTSWIRQATSEIMADSELAPELLLTYLPHLDYSLQKYGPNAKDKIREAVSALTGELKLLLTSAAENGYAVVVAGDYNITEASAAVYPNRILRDAGMLWTRQVRGRSYIDLFGTPAFAMVDHQIAHVYIRDEALREKVVRVFQETTGVERVEYREELLNHPNSGEVILIAAPGYWFAYPWWQYRREEPDYAIHMDIHNKIGFDPCELFLEKKLPPQVTRDTSKVKGTHGRDDKPVAFATTAAFSSTPRTYPELVSNIRQ
ncbi:MAG: alkaline phosphatase family protein, partial [Lentisphaeria bacterium]